MPEWAASLAAVFLRDADSQPTPQQRLAIKRGHGRRDSTAGQADKGKAAGLTRLRVVGQFNRKHGAMWLEQLAQLLRRRLERQIAHVEGGGAGAVKSVTLWHEVDATPDARRK